MSRGGYRPRLPEGELPISVSSGRWGRRRLRTDECWREVCAEDVHTELLRLGRMATFHGPEPISLTVGGVRMVVMVEILRGRVLLRCRRCGRHRTRLYCPSADDPDFRGCRTCLGLTYESRTLFNYKPGGLVLGGYFLSHRSLAKARTRKRREDALTIRLARDAERRRNALGPA